MKPARFEYHAPESIDEAAGLLAEFGDDAKALAGGQSLVPMLSLRLARFEHLVDLNRVGGLGGIDRVDGRLRVGAIVRQAEAEVSPLVAEASPLMARALPKIGHVQIRNRGTIGGSIAHADPASELPAVALALEATIEATSRSGARRIPAREFFVSTWETALATDEVLTAVELPIWTGRCGFAVEEVARRHGDFALAGAVCAVALDGDAAVTRAAIALFGVAPTPVRAADAEAALVAAGRAADLADIGRLAAADLTPSGDLHASAAYRKHVAAVVVTRALARAIEDTR